MSQTLVRGKCPGCGNLFEAVPTSWVGHYPSACTCNHCGANLSWCTTNGSVYLSEFEPTGMVIYSEMKDDDL
jgi:hypothetical protein